MMPYIHVKRNATPLTESEWSFHFDESSCTLFLNSYVERVRASTRHKFKNVNCYDRLHRRSNTLDQKNIPLPEDVQEEAKNGIISKLTVRKWIEKD